MIRRQETEPSAWRLRWDLTSAWALVWIAHPSSEKRLRPEVHLFLADRYGRLARYHERRGHALRALALDRKAEKHFRLSGGGEPPPAVAVAMARPSPPTFVDAVSHSGPSDSDDAA